VLRRRLIVTLAAGLLAAPATAGPSPQLVGPDDLPARDLVGTGIYERDSWYVRGFNALFARDDAALDSSARPETELAQSPFMPFAGRRIGRVVIAGREAFGTVAEEIRDSDDERRLAAEAQADSLPTRTSTFERMLNGLATATTDGTIGRFLLFREGQLLDPFALADSERLLRSQSFISDARIVVEPSRDAPGEVDVLVFVRDRWPWGVKGIVKTGDKFTVEVYHRNVGGRGLNLEVETPYHRGKSPELGRRVRASMANVAGSFVDVSLESRRVWDVYSTTLRADRGFLFADITAIGGLELSELEERNVSSLSDGVHLDSRRSDLWLGWGLDLDHGRSRDRARRRLIPALGVAAVNYIEPPRWYLDDPDTWWDYTRVLGQVSFTDADYYTTNLVTGYGETEDMPDGTWLSVVAGYEDGENRDRLYHGIRLFRPAFLDNRRFVSLSMALGGFRRDGYFEDGVLDLAISGFSPLRESRMGYWRHFYTTSYTLGINQTRKDGLRLDEWALRDLDDGSVAGNQRLTMEAESVLFTPLSILGFRMAAFGYAGGGLVAGQKDPLFRQPWHVDIGSGVRLNNPRLVFPTFELRVGAVADSDGWDPVVTVRSGTDSFLRRRLPSAKPSVVPYR
jgi:hypothetical protein